MPTIARDARRQLLDEHDANPMRMITGDLWERTNAARDECAAFLGAEPSLCAFVNNATYGTALALNSLDLAEGDEIVITDHSYNATTLAVGDAGRRFGAKVVVAPVDLGASAADTVAAVLGRFSERTKLVIVDEVSSATAQRHPIAALTEAVHDVGAPILVDAAHSPGMLRAPLSGVDPDFWVGNMHKWAFAPGGTALFRVSQAWRDRLNPLVVSHFHHNGYPANIEQQGTRDPSTWLAAPVGLTLFERFGETEIQRHNAELAAYGQKVLGAALGVEAGELPDPGQGVSMRIIPLPDRLIPDHQAAMLIRRRIADELATEVAINLWRDRAWLRVSAQIYNSPDEYDRLADRLPAFLAAL
ncbi:aminotransferase class V-fold PLP-dependent enzyme [Allorhizocola rhizosphaerae]|uniref:aminotransferase class V-fold PLP-dependent enzyme n=1 Tax=Allorhizocola rhizosphaerae TaxID=1872709 RepID=UPI001FE9F7F6|nr:aminotransferase class V-fold PLP-dependent enzyme [Allorhizocola rhizosphaerae]